MNCGMTEFLSGIKRPPLIGLYNIVFRLSSVPWKPRFWGCKTASPTLLDNCYIIFFYQKWHFTLCWVLHFGLICPKDIVPGVLWFVSKTRIRFGLNHCWCLCIVLTPTSISFSDGAYPLNSLWNNKGVLVDSTWINMLCVIVHLR